MSGFFDAGASAFKPRKRIGPGTEEIDARIALAIGAPVSIAAAEQQIAQETPLLGRAAAGSEDPATLAAEMRDFAAAGKFRPSWEYSRLLLQGAEALERMVKLASG